jgi:phosphatidylserine/phosphatidylglycerophosphate/cardiolipin synthase-like enzyme
MQNAVAFADNDVVVIAWSYGRKLPGCMGFAVYRIDAKGKETALPSMAVFPGTKRQPAQTTVQFPIQKFYWKDPYARLIAGAQHAVLFLAFYPGTPSIVNWVAEAQLTNKDLFVRGCVTNPSTAAGFLYELQGVEQPKRKKGDPPGKQDPRVISATALTSVVPSGWQREILSAGFAVTHDKIVVIDPFSDNCVVATGSHNLGYKASYDNDDNLAIFKGQQALAQAYATHVPDIYDHFSWRWMVQEKGQKAADTMLSVKPDEWQSKYFGDKGEIRSAQLRFWLGAVPVTR